MAGSRPRHRVFALLAVLIPVLAFAALEGGLRAAHYRGDLSLFLHLADVNPKYLGPNEQLAARYFVNVHALPTPPDDLFLLSKPAHGIRIFALGESSTAGFPYGYNGTFSRVVHDALQDVLPGDTVEVVNLGLSATTSYALYDEIDEILDQHPDAVLIYAGHNEFYGALGTGSSETVGAVPALVRSYLRLQRHFKTVLLAREVAAGLARRAGALTGSRPDTLQSLMHQMVREELIPLDGPTYRRGVRQFRSNLRAILTRFHDAGVPVFIASLTSNLRDQPPFRSVATADLPRADQVFAQARETLAGGDRTGARHLFERARDLDALRFRAPGEFNTIIRTLAQETGAHYVPVDEGFAAAAKDGIPGSELFWEHLHPNQTGYHLMGRLFFEAIQDARFLGRAADTTRLRSWPAYYDRMELTEFDRRYAWHQIRSVTTSWPFVEREDPAGYPNDYSPIDAADSAAFDVVARRREAWPLAKFKLAGYYRAHGELDLALAEYRGLMREEPENATVRVYAADVFLQRGDLRDGRELLEQAYAQEPSAFTCYALGRLELDDQHSRRAVQLLEQAQQFKPDVPIVLFDLSRAYAQARDLERAREYADRLAMVKGDFPGLDQWRAQLAEPPR